MWTGLSRRGVSLWDGAEAGWEVSELESSDESSLSPDSALLSPESGGGAGGCRAPEDGSVIYLLVT